MRVLLTGHQGFIGAVAVPMLIDAGHEVVGLDSGLFDDCRFGSEEPPEVPAIRKDFRDVAPLDLEGFDAILHPAALSNDPLGNIDGDLTYDINLEGSVRLAKTAKEVGVERFVFASSCSTYGAAGDDLLDEEADFNPVTPYGIAKVKAEQAFAELADDNFSPTFMRNATAYGVSPRLRLDIVLNNLVAHAHTTGLVYMMSDGTPWRPIVHLRDIVAAMIAAAEAPREAVHNQAFNVCRPAENYRIRELAEIVAEVVPGSRIEYAADAGPDKRTYRVDCSKITEMLPAFKPQWNARQGAEELYAAYQAANLTKEDVEGRRFIRLKHIKGLMESGKLGPDLRWTTVSVAT